MTNFPCTILLCMKLDDTLIRGHFNCASIPFKWCQNNLRAFTKGGWWTMISVRRYYAFINTKIFWNSFSLCWNRNFKKSWANFSRSFRCNGDQDHTRASASRINSHIYLSNPSTTYAIKFFFKLAKDAC